MFTSSCVSLLCVVQLRREDPGPTWADGQTAGGRDRLQDHGARKGLHAGQEEGKLSVRPASCPVTLPLPSAVLVSVHLSSLPLPRCLQLDGIDSSFPNGRWSKSSIPPSAPLSLSPEHSLPHNALTQRDRGKKTQTQWEAAGGEERKMLTFSVLQNETSHLTKHPHHRFSNWLLIHSYFTGHGFHLHI